MRRSPIVPIVVALLISGLVLIGGSLLEPQPEPTATPTPSTPTPTAMTCEDGGLDELLTWGGLSNQNITTDIDWAKLPESTPRNAFSESIIENPDDVFALAKTSSEVSDILDGTLSTAEADRARTSQGWEAVQLTQDLSLPTNYQLVDGSAVRHPSTAVAGEVLWVYVPTDTCGVDKTLAIRAWCGNPNVWVSKEAE